MRIPYRSQVLDLGLDFDRELIRVKAAKALFGIEGEVRIGCFAIVRRLGCGATSVVYEARDLRDGSVVALKVLSGSSAAQHAQLKREFRSLADVVHPNLVTLHELFVDPPHLFFTMTRVVGVPFDRFIASAAPRQREPALRAALVQLLHGVEAIHAARRVHGDLKPTNVLVTDTGRVVLLDFGLVGELDADATTLGTEPLLGTPAYMAPETWAGAALSPARDWYAVGVMLFEALCIAAAAYSMATSSCEHDVQWSHLVNMEAPACDWRLARRSPS